MATHSSEQDDVPLEGQTTLSKSVGSLTWRSLAWWKSPPVILGTISVGALATAFILPAGSMNSTIICPYRIATGHLCPFCGMTRGFIALAHLDPMTALQLNPSTPLIFAAFVWAAFRSLRAIRRGDLFEWPKARWWLRWGFLGAITPLYLFLWWVRVIPVWF